jgi:hypothetical protein
MLHYPIRVHTLAHCALMFVDGDLLQNASDISESLKAQLKYVNDTGKETPWGFKLDTEKGWIDIQILPTSYGGTIPSTALDSFRNLHKYVRRPAQEGPAYLVDLGMDDRYIVEFDKTSLSLFPLASGDAAADRYFLEMADCNRSARKGDPLNVTYMKLAVRPNGDECQPLQRFSVVLEQDGRDKAKSKWVIRDFDGSIFPTQEQLGALAKNAAQTVGNFVSDEVNFHFPRTWEPTGHQLG